MENKYRKETRTPFRSCEHPSSRGLRMEDLHWHQYYEVLFVRKSGGYTVMNSGNSHVGSVPEIFIHRPYTPHKIINDTGEIYERYIVYVYKNTLREFSERILDLTVFDRACMICIKPTEKESDDLAEICDHIREADVAKDQTEASILIALLLHRLMKFVQSGRCEIFRSNAEYIQDVLQYIDGNFAENLTVASLCEKFSVGHTKLLSDFRKATGMTYKKFLTDLRMTRARELILSGSSIINASLEAGYSSEAHFIKAFREYFGITPGAARDSRS